MLPNKQLMVTNALLYICSLATYSPGDDDKFCTEVDAYDMDLCVCLYNMHGHSIFKKLNTAMLVATFLKLCISYILVAMYVDT